VWPLSSGCLSAELLMAATPSCRLPVAENRAALRLLLVQAALLGTWSSVGMPANAVVSGFALDVLGMSREDAGLIGSCVYLAAVWQFLSFVITNRIANRQRFVVLAGAGEVLCLLLTLAVPWLFGKGNAVACGVFLGLLALSGSCLHVAQPILGSWLSAVVPARIRGRYLGSRQVLMTGLATVGTWVGVRVVDHWHGWGGFAAVVVGCGLAGLTGVAVLARTPMPPVSRQSHFRLRDFAGVLRLDAFRRYLVFVVMLFAGFSLACCYYAAFFLVEIGLSFTQIGWYITGHNILMIAVLRPGGRLVDRIGAKPVLMIMLLLYAAFYLCFPFFTASRYWLILLAWTMVGIPDGLYWVAGTSTLYHSLPRGPERAGYLAVAQGVIMVGMGVGPLLVRLYLELARHLEFVVCGVRIERFRLLYAICGLTMLATLGAAARLRNTAPLHSRDAFAALLRAAVFKLLPLSWR
jgi:MFS family permease